MDIARDIDNIHLQIINITVKIKDQVKENVEKSKKKNPKGEEAETYEEYFEKMKYIENVRAQLSNVDSVLTLSNTGKKACFSTPAR